MGPLNIAFKQKVGGSALTPLLYLFGACATFCVGSYASGSALAGHVALGMTCFVLLVTVGVYLFLLFKDRDRLHTENHLQQMRTIGLLGDNLTGPVLEGAAVANPYNGGARDEL